MYNTKRMIAAALCVGAAVLIAGRLSAFAQDPDVTVNFVGVGGNGLPGGDPSSSTYNLSWFNGTGTTNEAAYTGEYGLQINSGPIQNVFCTSLNDNTYLSNPNEKWEATTIQTTQTAYNTLQAAEGSSHSDPKYDTHEQYAVGPNNIEAIDYITQTYASFTAVTAAQNADAQLAIWDLVNGGHITFNGSAYSWSPVFSATADGSGAPDMAAIYGIEHTALGFESSNPNWYFGSNWLLAEYGTQTSGDSSPVQDFTFQTPNPNLPPPAPEPASFAAFALVAFGIAGLALRRKVQGVQAS